MELDWIKCEDCIEGMRSIPDGSVDMVLTDPPFGTLDAFWDRQLPLDKMWAEFKRVTKHNAAMVIFSQLPFAVDVINANRKMFRYEWIWHKIMPVGFLNANKMPLRAHENILVFYRKLPTYNPQWWYSTPYSTKNHEEWQRNSYRQTKQGRVSTERPDGRRNPIDVVKYGEATHYAGKRSEHGTQKPVGLCEYLIRTYTNEGELVLDACMGIGTTAIAAVKANRRFIGFETHQPFIDIANRRIAEAREKLLNARTSLLEGFDDEDRGR